jgi:flagellar biosynthesis protein FlhA
MELRMSSTAVPRSAAPGILALIQNLILPIGLIACILVILAPLPAALMDLLLASNITIAVIMLLTTLYVRTPLEFSIFPSLLLVTTLFRLVLNVATTRLILKNGASEGLMAAGGVVQTFGRFVTGGGTGSDNLVIGLIIFSIIVLVQFVVITKGATRISEVAARFTLDGMPGKQMAIDAELNAGAINQREAQRRRQEIAQQADFYGAMDGAGKFVRGDAVAGIVIIFINIMGGLWVGIVQKGMDIGAAASIFTTLTIGDGLVTQVPAFLISLAAGMLVTRSNQESNLPKEFLRQLFARPQVLAISGGFLAILIFTHLPKIPLLLIASGCVGMAVVLSRRENKTHAIAEMKKQAEVTKSAQRVEDYLAVDPLELELGVGLIRLADAKRGGDLLERIQRVRQSLAAEIGVILPKVRVRDNMRLEQSHYRIKIAGMAVAEGFIDDKIAEPANAVAMHLSETVRQHADELLTRDAVKHLLDELHEASPAVVDELIPGVMKLGEVQQVLQLLLREAVPIRHLGLILETLGDCSPRSKEPELLVEHVRQRLARTLSTLYRDQDNKLRVVTLDPALEERILTAVERTEEGMTVRLPSREVEGICRSIASEVEKFVAAGRPLIVLVSPQIRAALKHLTAGHIPQLVVLGYNEITRDTKVESVAMVAMEEGDQLSTIGYKKSA